MHTHKYIHIRCIYTSCIRAYLTAYIHNNLFTYIPTYLHTYLPTYLPYIFMCISVCLSFCLCFLSACMNSCILKYTCTHEITSLFCFISRFLYNRERIGLSPIFNSSIFLFVCINAGFYILCHVCISLHRGKYLGIIIYDTL